MWKTHLPPGFRFHPTDVELVKYYLKRKVMGKKIHFDTIAEVDIYKFAPWDLPGKSLFMSGELKWYFFCPREKKYASGSRLKRATEIGFWKSTGKDRPVLYNSEVAGMIKTLVFHLGKTPKGERTDWVIHEYRLEDKDLALGEVAQDAYVLCVVFKKDGPGPKNGAQYGAPFNEEDWSDNEEVDRTEPVSASIPPVMGPPEPANKLNSIASASHALGDILAEPFASSVLPSANDMLPAMNWDGDDVLEFPQIPNVDHLSMHEDDEFPQIPTDDILSMLDLFTDKENFLWSGSSQNERTDNANDAGNAGVLPCAKRNNCFGGLLSDAGGSDAVSKELCNHSGADSSHEMHNLGSMTRKASFLEIFDLDAPLNAAVQAGRCVHHLADALQGYYQNPSCALPHAPESIQTRSHSASQDPHKSF